MAGTATTPASSIAERFEHFSRVDCRGYSPLYEAVAAAVAGDDCALAVIAEAPIDKQHPTIVLAVIHDLALAGRAPEVAAAFASADGDASGRAVVAAIVEHREALLATARERQTQTNEVGRSALLYPAVAEAAARVGAARIALIDVGCSGGLNLHVDRFSISYSDGVTVGDAASPVQLSCELVGEGRPPRPNAFPVVVERIGIDLRPVDVRDPAEARWLQACLWPDQPERMARLVGAFEVAAADPPRFVPGNVIDVLPGVLAGMADDVVPVLMSTWAIAYLKPSDRMRFLQAVSAAAVSGRPVAWVSGEGVGLAPSVPTLGDDKTSGHSLMGIAIARGRRLEVETVARCHPHGRWIEWLAP